MIRATIAILLTVFYVQSVHAQSDGDPLANTSERQQTSRKTIMIQSECSPNTPEKSFADKVSSVKPGIPPAFLGTWLISESQVNVNFRNYRSVSLEISGNADQGYCLGESPVNVKRVEFVGMRGDTLYLRCHVNPICVEEFRLKLADDGQVSGMLQFYNQYSTDVVYELVGHR